MNKFQENKADTPSEPSPNGTSKPCGSRVACSSRLSGYTMDELLGQDPHFMNGAGTDPDAVRRYQTAITEGRDEKPDILQYWKDSTPFRAMLFASPVDDGQGTVTNHFLSYLDITRRYQAEEGLWALTA